jgi:hypothetical protein
MQHPIEAASTADVLPNPHRCGLLGEALVTLASARAVTAAQATPGATPDAELIALHAELLAHSGLIAVILAWGKELPDGMTPQSDAQENALASAMDDWFATMDRITDIRPVTPAGFRAKADAVRRALEQVEGTAGIGEGPPGLPDGVEWQDRLTWSFAHDVLAGEAVA